MKKIAIAGVISNPVLSKSSHNGGWTMVLKNIIETFLGYNITIITEKDDWNIYDMILLTEGVNFKEGSFNFFGGVQEKQIIKLQKLNKYKGEVRSLSGELDYNIVMNKRKELKDFDFTFNVPKQINIKDLSNKLILGDSHSVSIFKKGYTISRNDGKTLRGFLKKDISNYVSSNVNELIFYAGNIDVRFHMFNPNRSGNYIIFCKELINKMSKQLKNMNLKKITCVKLIPIEEESRKIPKTGQLDGVNFYGSFKERSNAVAFFNQELETMCVDNGFELLNWDFNYDEALPFDHMEARQSVHLRPSSYMFNESNVSTIIENTVLKDKEQIDLVSNLSLSDFISYYEKAKKIQEFKYQNINWTELDVNDDLMWNVPIYDIVNRKFAAFSSLLEALKNGEKDPKKNGKFFPSGKDLTDVNFIKLCYLFRLCGSGINYKPKTSDKPWGTHGFGNFWIVNEIKNGSICFDDWINNLPENKFCDVKGYLLPMVKGGLRSFIVNESNKLVENIIEFIKLKEKVGIKDVVDFGNQHLIKLGIKRQNFVLTAFAMDLAEYFPHRVDRDSDTYVGSNAKKCLKKILPGIKTDKALRVLCNETNNYSKPYDMEDVACDYIRYCDSFQSKEHIKLNKGIRYERSVY